MFELKGKNKSLQTTTDVTNTPCKKK